MGFDLHIFTSQFIQGIITAIFAFLGAVSLTAIASIVYNAVKNR